MYSTKLIVSLAGLLLFAFGAAMAANINTTRSNAPRSNAHSASPATTTFEEFKEFCGKAGGTSSVVRSENGPRPGRPPPVYQRNDNSEPVKGSESSGNNRTPAPAEEDGMLADTVRRNAKRTAHNPQSGKNIRSAHVVNPGDTEPTYPLPPPELGHVIDPSTGPGPTFPDPPPSASAKSAVAKCIVRGKGGAEPSVFWLGQDGYCFERLESDKIYMEEIVINECDFEVYIR